MPTALRSFTAWIAIACLAFGSLLPLSSLATAKTPASAMAICSTGTAWQSPGSAPGQPAHGHCTYCSSSQPFVLDLPTSNVDAFRATCAYLSAQMPRRSHLPHLSLEDNRARAPPG